MIKLRNSEAKRKYTGCLKTSALYSRSMSSEPISEQKNCQELSEICVEANVRASCKRDFLKTQPHPTNSLILTNTQSVVPVLCTGFLPICQNQIQGLFKDHTTDIHRVSKKLCQLIFCSLSVKYEPISIKIGRIAPEETLNETVPKLPTSPKVCACTTLGNLKWQIEPSTQ